MSPGSLKLITTTRMDNAHNWFLNIGANYGLISLFFLLAILAVVLFYSASHLKNQSKSGAVAVSASVAFVCVFIDGIVSLEQPGIGIWLYLFAGVVAASALEQATYSSEISSAKVSNSVIPSVSTRIVNLTMTFLLLISCASLTQRVSFDAILRSSVQTVLLNKGTNQTVSNIESATIRLRSEPEYSTQALQSLAALGDAGKLDSISKVVYDYYPNSIQASLIRADVLMALNRESESCRIRNTLLKNTPWDLFQLEKYILCVVNGYAFPDSSESLAKASEYFSEVDRSDIPSDPNEIIEVTSRLNQVAIRARSQFILGKVQSARELQAYGNKLLARLVELQAFDPSLVPEIVINKNRKTLKF